MVRFIVRPMAERRRFKRFSKLMLVRLIVTRRHWIRLGQILNSSPRPRLMMRNVFTELLPVSPRLMRPLTRKAVVPVLIRSSGRRLMFPLRKPQIGLCQNYRELIRFNGPFNGCRMFPFLIFSLRGEGSWTVYLFRTYLFFVSLRLLFKNPFRSSRPALIL